MNKKIAEAFENGKAFIPFVTCGDPSLEVTEQLVYAMAEAGADLIELGIPFSDPTAEGPVIQAANVRALAGGVTTDKIFDLVVRIRQKTDIPMVFMTYANVVYSYGTERFIAKAAEIGAQIEKDFAGEEVVLIGILRGAVLWMGDIMKNVNLDMIIDFMAVSSYGSSTKSSGVVKINKDLDTNISGKNVIIVEDIVDSGTTLNYLKEYLQNHDAKCVKICTLLDKPEGRRVDIDVDYIGFTVDDRFIVGYGLDFDQKYRNLPYITYLEQE